jgi:hypothetical protein
MLFQTNLKSELHLFTDMPIVPEYRKHIAIKNVIEATIYNIKTIYVISLGVILVVIGLWLFNTPYFTSQFLFDFIAIYMVAQIFIFCIIKLHLKSSKYISDILSNKEVDLPDNHV